MKGGKFWREEFSVFFIFSDDCYWNSMECFRARRFVFLTFYYFTIWRASIALNWLSLYSYNPANGANCEDAFLESVHHEE